MPFFHLTFYSTNLRAPQTGSRGHRLRAARDSLVRLSLLRSAGGSTVSAGLTFLCTEVRLRSSKMRQACSPLSVASMSAYRRRWLKGYLRSESWSAGLVRVFLSFSLSEGGVVR